MPTADVSTLAFPNTIEEESGATAYGVRSAPVARRSRLPKDASAYWTSVAEIKPELDWLERAFKRLRQLLTLPADWSLSPSIAAPNDIAVRDARAALRELANVELKPLSINPSVEEGICIAFRNGTRYADIECFNSGEMVAAISDGRGNYHVWGIEREGELGSAVLLIQEHLIAHV